MSDQTTATDPGSAPATRAEPATPAPDPARRLDSAHAPGSFAAATAITPTGEPNRFTAELDPGWSIAGRANGGYLVSVLGRAATAADHTTSVLAASTHFLKSPHPGTAEVTVEPLSSGRTISHVRARLSQAGRPCAEAMFTLGALGDVPATWTGYGPQPGAAPLAECIPLHPDPAVFPVPLLDLVDLRLSPATTGWTAGRPTGRGELTGWLALPGAAAFDPIALLFAVDAFPPATFDVQMSGWVPSFQLSTYVRALPVPGPVQILHRANVIADGRVDETCHVWDKAGTLVAQSTQLAGIRLG